MIANINYEELNQDIRSGVPYRDICKKYKIGDWELRQYRMENEIFREGNATIESVSYPSAWQEWFAQEWTKTTQALARIIVRPET